MLKKTLLATAAISATLFAVAAVLPEVAQSRSSGTSSTSNAQSLASAPVQDKRQTDDDGRIGKTERRRDRQEIDENEREGRAVAANVGAGTEGSDRSTYEDDKGDSRRDDRHGPKGKRDHDRSSD